MPIVVNHGALDNTSTQLTNDANAIQATLDELDSKIQQLLGSWSGDAQTAYTQAKNKWSSAMTEIRQTLSTISTQLSEANDQFGSIDKQGASMFS
ncbi:MAG: WXG100 family type VII secretion target [Propionibacteriaceae bacterium]|nr:WXG100 family type VII secretion target [Propionibacteriaceae bacterium]